MWRCTVSDEITWDHLIIHDLELNQNKNGNNKNEKTTITETTNRNSHFNKTKRMLNKEKNS